MYNYIIYNFYANAIDLNILTKKTQTVFIQKCFNTLRPKYVPGGCRLCKMFVKDLGFAEVCLNF